MLHDAVSFFIHLHQLLVFGFGGDAHKGHDAAAGASGEIEGGFFGIQGGVGEKGFADVDGEVRIFFEKAVEAARFSVGNCDWKKGDLVFYGKDCSSPVKVTDGRIKIPHAALGKNVKPFSFFKN